MGTFLLIAGVCIGCVGLIAVGLTDGETGFGPSFGGMLMVIFGILMQSGPTKETKKDETSAIDSTQVVIPKDSIYAVRFIVQSKDTDGVYVGNGIKLMGHTEKNDGDTIIIPIK